ncbi:MAG: hypothetical protein JXA13_15350 [Anaerolineales bacterium]|nr:hypothetical protein [Anaerolineales bacterium]
MLTTIVSWTVSVIMLLTSAGLLLSRDWRIQLGLLAVQYLGVFWLVQLHWPLAMAATKLITGWMVTAILGITYNEIQGQVREVEENWQQGHAFRIFAVSIVSVIALAITPQIPQFLPGIGLQEVTSSLILIGIGILHLGITTQYFRVILSLLTVLAGFETIYAAIEGSVLVAALLTGTALGLALVGSYILIAPNWNKTE